MRSKHPHRRESGISRPKILALLIAASASGPLAANPESAQVEPKAPIDAPAPRAGRIKERVKHMHDVRLDLSSVRVPQNVEDRCAKAKELLAEIIRNGDPVLAQHAISFLSYVPDPGLEEALRSRLQKTGEEWSEKHLEMGARHYLAMLGDMDSLGRVVASADSNQVSLRARAFRALRDIEPNSVDPKTRRLIRDRLERACNSEHDPACQAASLSALACWSDEKTARRHFARLEEAASDPTGRRNLRAAFEARQIKRWSVPATAGPSPQDNSALTEPYLHELLQNGGHDEQMFALEALAQRKTASIQTRMSGMGLSEDWKNRLKSAFYLMLVRDVREADARLGGEKHPFVQLALLCAMGFDTISPPLSPVRPPAKSAR